MRQWIVEAPEQMAKVCAYLSRLPVESVLCLTLDDYKHPRTLKQNRRLFLLHTKAAEATGYSVEEMHEFALMRHFGHQEISVGNLTRRVPLKRSSTRDKAEFAKFMEETEAFYISDLGVWLE